MKKLMLLTVVLFLFSLTAFAVERMQIAYQDENGNTVNSPISYDDYGDSIQVFVEIQRGPQFSFKNESGVESQVSLEQCLSDVLKDGKSPVLMVFNGGATLYGKLDVEKRLITFPIVTSSQIKGMVFNTYLESKKGKYWLHAIQFPEFGKDTWAWMIPLNK